MNDIEDVSLSEREIDIIRLVATGASNKEIAVALSISPNTVKVHLRNIFGKIGVVSRTEATLYAIKNHYVDTPRESNQTENNGDNFLSSGSPIALVVNDGIAASSRRKIEVRNWTILLSITGVVLIGLTIFAYILARNFSSTNSNPSSQTKPANERWEYSVDYIEPISAASSLSYGGAIYLIGGRTENDTSARTMRYSPNDDRWVTLKDKPLPVSETQAGIIQEKIFIPGGRLADGNPTKQLDSYDILSNTWTVLMPLPEPLMGSAVASVDGILYVIGGWNGQAYSNRIYMYQPDQDLWKEANPLPNKRAYMAVVVIEGHILLIGGEDDHGPSDEVLIYYPSRDNVTSNVFEKGTPLPQPRTRAGAVYLANIIYVFGGKIDQTGTPDNITLEPGQDQWNGIDEPLAGIGSLPIVQSTGNYIHVIGGHENEHDINTHQVYQAIYTISIPLTTSQ